MYWAFTGAIPSTLQVSPDLILTGALCWEDTGAEGDSLSKVSAKFEPCSSLTQIPICVYS